MKFTLKWKKSRMVKPYHKNDIKELFMLSTQQFYLSRNFASFFTVHYIESPFQIRVCCELFLVEI